MPGLQCLNFKTISLFFVHKKNTVKHFNGRKRFQSFQSGSDGSKPLRPPPPPPCCRCSFHLHPGKGAYLLIISVSMSAVQSWSRLFGLSILITLFSPMNSFNLHHYEWAILMQSLHSGAPLRNTISLCWPSCRSSKYYCLSFVSIPSSSMHFHWRSSSSVDWPQD